MFLFSFNYILNVNKNIFSKTLETKPIEILNVLADIKNSVTHYDKIVKNCPGTLNLL